MDTAPRTATARVDDAGPWAHLAPHLRDYERGRAARLTGGRVVRFEDSRDVTTWDEANGVLD